MKIVNTLNASQQFSLNICSVNPNIIGILLATYMFTKAATIGLENYVYFNCLKCLSSQQIVDFCMQLK